MIISEVVDSRSLPWSQVDEENWNAFLQTETGRRLLPKLLEQAVPPLLDRGHVNAILIRSGEVRGVQQVAQVLISLTHSQTPPAAVDNYPAPENDKAWEDGNKLSAQTQTKVVHGPEWDKP